jgi:hypothetical protein
VFIDGAICVINKHIYDESSSDLKENITLVEYNRWVDSSTITHAQVTLTDLQEVTLTLNLSNNNSIIFALDTSKKGSIKFLTDDS